LENLANGIQRLRESILFTRGEFFPALLRTSRSVSASCNETVKCPLRSKGKSETTATNRRAIEPNKGDKRYIGRAADESVESLVPCLGSSLNKSGCGAVPPDRGRRPRRPSALSASESRTRDSARPGASAPRLKYVANF